MLSNSGITVPTEYVSVENIVCENLQATGSDSNRKLQASGFTVTQNILVTSFCSDISGISCDENGLETLISSSTNTAAFGSALDQLLGPVVVQDLTVEKASLKDVTELPTALPTASPTHAYLCLWDTGCDTTSPDKMCEPGSTCMQYPYWSQCQENTYSARRQLLEKKDKSKTESNGKSQSKSRGNKAKLQTDNTNTPPTCYATNNGPYGGQRWGCSTDSDCCNPDATCGSDKLCHLQCSTQNVNAPPTYAPTTTPTLTPNAVPTLSPTKNPIAPPTLNPTAKPTETPTLNPITNPTKTPTKTPTLNPTKTPTKTPTLEPTSASLVAAYKQCGGKSYNGPTQCIPGYGCETVNAWWYQCNPIPSTNAPVSAPVHVPTSSHYMCKWETGCGNSAYSCEPGSYCKEYQYWSQCLENSVPTTNCVGTDQWGPSGGGSSCCNPAMAWFKPCNELPLMV